jgi:hypothetical protein
MTPERLNYLIEGKLRRRRKAGQAAHYADIARFLGVEPITLRRWLKGRRPIPRAVEVVMEIFHRWPEVTAELVDEAIRARDEAAGK